MTRERGLGAVALYTIVAGLTAHRRRAAVVRADARVARGRAPADAGGVRARCCASPSRFARMTLLRWALGVPLFAVPDLTSSWQFALEVAVATRWPA